jgi:hypothetical protein
MRKFYVLTPATFEERKKVSILSNQVAFDSRREAVQDAKISRFYERQPPQV